MILVSSKWMNVRKGVGEVEHDDENSRRGKARQRGVIVSKDNIHRIYKNIVPFLSLLIEKRKEKIIEKTP